MKKTATLSSKEAIALYSGLNEAGKKIMERKFGKRTFEPPKPKKATSKNPTRPSSFLEACKTKGIKPDSVIPYKNAKTPLQRRMNALGMLDVITEVINGGREVDFSDSNQPKYFIWFDWSDKEAGFVFGNAYYYCTSTNAGLAPRLCFFNREDAEYAGKTFIKLYNQLLLGK